MQARVHYGSTHATFEVPEGTPARVVQDGPAPLANPQDAMRAALENPFEFPALKEALTPDDHITLVVDERLPDVGRLLTPIIEHIMSAGVPAGAITLLCPPSLSRQPWIEELPDAMDDLHMEVHDPANARHLAYLATTQAGRRVYLNRTLIEADQVVVLTARRFDPLMGYGGGESALFPILSDEETRDFLRQHPRADLLGSDAPEAKEEAREVCWLLGVPFFVQVIESSGDGVARIVAGVADSFPRGQELLDTCWRRQIDRRPDVIVAGVGGDPARRSFEDLASAFFHASHVIAPRGRIILLSQTATELTRAEDRLRGASDPSQMLLALDREMGLDQLSAWQWAQAAADAKLYLLSNMEDEVVEDLFANPVHNHAQVQRLLEGSKSCLFLDDAQRFHVEVKE
jgi:nickel-dependent lactate racemase